MIDFPDRPFLTEDFSPKGGGLDFLGTRLVNLTILGEYLLPGINNATEDFGTYCLAAWIPWKFRNLCQNSRDFTFSNYRKFREALEVMISYTMRDESPSTLEFDKARNRVGNRQILSFPSNLSFKDVHRKESNTIYAAALYGPSVRYLDLVDFAIDGNGIPTNILLPKDDETTIEIVKYIDQCLQKSPFYHVINQLRPSGITAKGIDDLGMHALNPAFFRKSNNIMKKKFLNKLLPNEGSVKNGRTLTAILIGHTLKSCGNLSIDQLRSVWHTGLKPSGAKLPAGEEDIQKQRELWSIFQCRQIQRTFLELFLQAFEIALYNHSQTIDEIVDYSINEWEQNEEPVPENINDLIHSEILWHAKSRNLTNVSEAWNKNVSGQHPYYDNITSDSIESPVVRATKMMVRWFLRTRTWPNSYKMYKQVFIMGGPERISISYCLDWINERLSIPFVEFLNNLFTDFVFVQHMRIALSRFEEETQKLRFIISDHGIVSTLSVGKKIGKSFKVMDDRLECFLGLLTDLNVIDENYDSTYSLGNNSDCII